LINFKCYEIKEISFDNSSCMCIIGPNSSGKSTILDAVKFVTLHPDCSKVRGLVRRCHPPILKCTVTAVFEVSKVGQLTLQREVILDSPKQHRVTYAVAVGERPLRDLEEANYAAWIEKLLRWGEDSVIVSQFSLMEQSSVTQLLSQLSQALDRFEEAAQGNPPVMKRQMVRKSSSPTFHATGARAKAEAWVGRRLDEIYRELSREPLDEVFRTWGEGGQACLRRLHDGSFTIFTSVKRGLAASGYGSPLESISDGDRDLCALALLLTLPALSFESMELQDALPPMIILDGCDSRLDRRAASCLWRFLSRTGQPVQCMLLSLNNHGAFNDQSGAIVLPELPKQSFHKDDADSIDDPYGDVRHRPPAPQVHGKSSSN
jgi:energy-coupling factor transporter ATP-binding protein EcfA2